MVVGDTNFRVYHFIAIIALLDFTHSPHPLAFAQLLLLAGIKMDEAQHQHTARIVLQLYHQLFTRFELHLLQQHLALYLHRHTQLGIVYHGDVGFVFITQRQVQNRIPNIVYVQFRQFGLDFVGNTQIN